ncbi:circularly permuted type 2 ATP-grasp protein [Mycobacterium tilburgii]|uniref:circularly permuted type 2 ATP-grasp protein n=1 Tax=Mycobacterium tilburgii TaxID=44467 RepID=UPI0021B17DD3|nr:circularly permuted type 2 ATP-grasp protein [Mycobacterium tilburgii]
MLAADGRRTGRGPRPVLPRQPSVHGHPRRGIVRSTSSIGASTTSSLDPLQFRADSVLGVAGLVSAARAGNVVISSAIGNGVGDGKLVIHLRPDHDLSTTWARSRCWPTWTRTAAGSMYEREEVLDRLRELVIEPVEGSGGYGIVFDPEASEKELAGVSKKIREDPRSWIAPADDGTVDRADADRQHPGAALRRPVTTAEMSEMRRRLRVCTRPDSPTRRR